MPQPCKRSPCPKSVPEDATYCSDLCSRIQRVSLLLRTAQSPEAGAEALAAAHLVLSNMRKYDLVFYVRDPQRRASLALGVERYEGADGAERDRRATALLAASKGAVLLTTAESVIADRNAAAKAARAEVPTEDAPASRVRTGLGGFFTLETMVAAGAALLGATEIEPGRTVRDVVQQVTGNARAIRAEIQALLDELGVENEDETPPPPKTRRAKAAKPKRATKRKPAKKNR